MQYPKQKIKNKQSKIIINYNFEKKGCEVRKDASYERTKADYVLSLDTGQGFKRKYILK